MSPMNVDEKILFINSFGAITDQRVILDYKTAAEEIPLEQISSVSIQHRRNKKLARAGLLAALALLLFLANIHNRMSDAGIVLYSFIPVACIFSAISNTIGYPCIEIGITGNSMLPMIVRTGQNAEARRFVTEIIKVISQELYAEEGKKKETHVNPI